LSSAQAWKKVGEGSGLRGNGAAMTEGGARPFIGTGGASRRRQWAVTVDVKAFMPMMAGGGLSRGVNWGN
jgi:hypothetical protein